MADAVAAGLAEKRHLIAEAGTGVGKSFAYLVPAILATADSSDGKPLPGGSSFPRTRSACKSN